MFRSLMNLFISSVSNGAPLMFGTTGEILTQKSGNLNLGVEGLMYMGGAFGLYAAIAYQDAAGASANGIVMVILAILASFAAGMLGSLIYAFLTISLKANQNVTGLALATFGTGVGKYVGDAMKFKFANPVIATQYRNFFKGSPFPDTLKNIPVVGELLFGHSIFVYVGIVLTVFLAIFFGKSRKGLNLRAVGENPATADAAGINVEKYKYFATIFGGGISALGGMVYYTTIGGGIWDSRALTGEGWIAVALVIFCMWKPLNTTWGSLLFGALSVMYIRVPLSWLPSEIYKIVPYIVTVVVLIIVSIRQKREDQPPAALGLSYFREER